MAKALMVYGGWGGHEPKETTAIFAEFLRGQGFDVDVRDTLDAYLDAELMGSVDLIVQCWTMGQITKEQFEGLSKAVENGAGLAGWHGGLCDAFRASIDYHRLSGGQFLAHPGGLIEYDVHVTNWDDPIMAGIENFRTCPTEQYYMMTDPANLVLATTPLSPNCGWAAGAVMPQVWKRQHGKGRVFFSALGHVAKDFTDMPQARTIMERGLLWATRQKGCCCG